MRLALVSDIHGNLAALEAVLEDVRHRGVDQVINLGDTVSGPLLPEETAQRLRGLPWLHLGGNHERQLLTLPAAKQNASDAYSSAQLSADSLRWLAGHADPCDPRLHEGRMWGNALGPDVALCHGSPRSDLEYLLETPDGSQVRLAHTEEIEQRLDGRIPESIALLACGHSHVPRSLRLQGGLLIVNPGSVGLPAYDDDHPTALAASHRIESGSTDARYAVVEKIQGRWRCDLISLPYEHEAMARLADRNGRPDWASALRSGRMPDAPAMGHKV